MPTDAISQRELRDVAIQWAMWADKNMFGHDLSDEEYEHLCEQLSMDIGDEIYLTLLARDPR